MIPKETQGKSGDFDSQILIVDGHKFVRSWPLMFMMKSNGMTKFVGDAVYPFFLVLLGTGALVLLAAENHGLAAAKETNSCLDYFAGRD